jgi:hypothetical protein
MICPLCKAEYRRGFTVCRDCDVPLVELAELAVRSEVENEPAATPGDPRQDPFCSFWKGTDLRVCTEICTVLDEAGIPHKTIRRQDHLFNLNNQSPYQVGVPASLYEKAELAIKDAFGAESDGRETPLLLTEGSGQSFQELTNLPLEEKLRRRSEEETPSFLDSLTWRNRGTEEERVPLGSMDHANWYPEDATAEAWSGEPPEAREMIEMSLRENDVRMRWETTQDTNTTLYVLPEDQERAQEIVREILEGQALD